MAVLLYVNYSSMKLFLKRWGGKLDLQVTSCVTLVSFHFLTCTLIHTLFLKQSLLYYTAVIGLTHNSSLH